MATLPKQSATQEIATFAAGCFWCIEPPFDKVDGVQETIVGYTAGHKENPTYEEVCTGSTGHTEAIRVYYDPLKVTYKKLLEVFWRNVDPTTKNRQFCDTGNQYRSGIYVHNDSQRSLAEASKAAIEKEYGYTVVTEIEDAGTFYPAEEYHQAYYEKNPFHYKSYRIGCGRDARLKELWDK